MAKSLFSCGNRLGRDSHVSDEELLTLIDGEAEFRKFCSINTHLKRCWLCRARLERLEESIASFMEHRNAIMHRQIPPPPDGWRRFDFRLQDTAEEFGRAARHRRTHRYLRSAACAVASVTVLVVLWTSPASAAWTRQIIQTLGSLWSGSDTQPIHKVVPGSGAAVARNLISAPQAPAMIPPAKTRKEERRSVLTPLPPSPLELDAAEVKARFILHRLGACLGEQIECVRNANTIGIRGLVDSAERKQRILDALAGLPYQTIEIRTFEEALHDVRSPSDLAAEPARIERIPDSRKPFADRLSPLIKAQRAEDTLARSRDAVSLADEALRNVWALRRLYDVYSAEHMSRLNAESRRMLIVMVSDHATQLRDVLSRYRKDVIELISIPAAEQPRHSGVVSIPELFRDVETMNRLTRSIFADSDDPASDPRGSVLALLEVLAASEQPVDRPDSLARVFSVSPIVAANQ
jgi:hypothetical protein